MSTLPISIPAPVPAARPVSTPAKGSRLQSIDGLRGLLMACMALDHAAWYLARTGHADEFWGGTFATFDGPVEFLTRFISHFCAPGFFFLMGASMVLLQASRQKAGWSDRKITLFFLQRGLVFIGIQFLIENPLWALSFRASFAEMAGYFGVLFGLGAAMALGSLFLRFSSPVLLAISLLGILFSEALVPASSHFATAYPLALRLLLVAGQTGHIQVYYPLFPWLFVALLGIPFGRALRKNADRAFAVATTSGLLSLAAFALVRFLTPYGNLQALPAGANWIQYFTLTKYPPSFLFLSLTLGVDVLVLAAWNRWQPAGALARLFNSLGQAPFFFYVAHLALFAILGIAIGKPGVGPGQLHLLWIFGVLFLVPYTQWYAGFKQGTSPTSLWRLL